MLGQAIGEGAYARVIISAASLRTFLLKPCFTRSTRPSARILERRSDNLRACPCMSFGLLVQVAVKEMRCGQGAGILPDASVQRAMFEVKARVDHTQVCSSHVDSDSTEVMRQLTNASDSGHALKTVYQSVGFADAFVTGGLRVPSLLDHQLGTQHCHPFVVI